MNYLLFAFALPKRHAIMHWFYRRAYRAYAWFYAIPDRQINMDGTRLAFYLLFGAGPVIGLVVALIMRAVL